MFNSSWLMLVICLRRTARVLTSLLINNCWTDCSTALLLALLTASRALSPSYISLAGNLQTSGKLPRPICRRNMFDVSLQQNPQLNRKQTHLCCQTDDNRFQGMSEHTADFWEVENGRGRLELQLHACRGKEQNHSDNNPNSLEIPLLTLHIVSNRYSSRAVDSQRSWLRIKLLCTQQSEIR